MNRVAGEDDPESPLTFAMPRSLQDYMNRYMNIGERTGSLPPPPTAGLMYSPAELSPPTFPTRHWFDDAIPIADVPPSPIVPSGGVVDATGAPSWADTPHRLGQGPPSFGSEYREYLSATRSVSGGRPFLGPIDSFCEDDDHRFNPQTHDNGRPQSRWGARPRPNSRGVTQESTPRRGQGAVLGHRGSGVARGGFMTPPARPTQLQLLGARTADSASDEDDRQTWQSYVDERPMHPYGGAVERGTHSPLTTGGGRGGRRRPGSRGAGEGQRQSSVRRRSLADFLREIEDMVRSQRAEAAAARPRPPPSPGSRPEIAPTDEGEAQISSTNHRPSVNARPPRTSVPRVVDEQRLPDTVYRTSSDESLGAHYTWPAPSHRSGSEIVPLGRPTPDTVDGGEASVFLADGGPRTSLPRSSGAPTLSPPPGLRNAAITSTVESERADMARASEVVRADARRARIRRPGMRRRQQASPLQVTPLQVSPAETALHLGGGGGASATPSAIHVGGTSHATSHGNPTDSLQPGHDALRPRVQEGRGTATDWRSFINTDDGVMLPSATDANRQSRREDTWRNQPPQPQLQRPRRELSGETTVSAEFSSDTSTMYGSIADNRRTELNRNVIHSDVTSRRGTWGYSTASGGVTGPRARGEAQVIPTPTPNGPAAHQQQRVFGAVVEVLSSRGAYMAGLPREQTNRVSDGNSRGRPRDSRGLGRGGGNNGLGERAAGFALPTFGRWEPEPTPDHVRNQWEEAEAQRIREHGLASDGILTVAERPASGALPGGFNRVDAHDFGPSNGSEAASSSEVEGALFGFLTALGIRRLLFRRGKGLIPATVNHRSPAWLEEWLDRGAPAPREPYSGSMGDESRCPRVGDVWELLELLLAFWAERVTSVYKMVSSAREASVIRGPEEPGLRDFAVSAAHAVESVRDLRELKEHMMPLSGVRSCLNVPGGPTPRDAVLLKIVLVMHEGMLWVTERPYYTHYRGEVIPTALALYTCLPQDTLEGVDLEVGHTLPDSMFGTSNTLRPTWPRWGGSGNITHNTYGNNYSIPSIPLLSYGGPDMTATGGGIDIDAEDGANGIGPRLGPWPEIPTRTGIGFGTGPTFSTGTGFSTGFSQTFPPRFQDVDSSGGVSTVGGNGRTRQFTEYHGEAGVFGEGEGNIGGAGEGKGFVEGPWVVFRVKREEYIRFYTEQASALDQTVLGTTKEHFLC